MKDPYTWQAVRRAPRIRKGTHEETARVVYRVRYRVRPTSNQTSRTFDTLEDARRFDNEQEQRRLRERDGYGQTPPPKRSATFIAWFEEHFLPTRTNAGTRRAHLTRIAQIRSRPGGEQFLAMRLGTIRKTDVEKVLAACERGGPGCRPLAPGSINAIQQTILAVINDGSANGEIAAINWRLKPKARPLRDDPPNMAELMLLIDAVSPRFRTLAGLAAVTGLRSGELRGLALEDVRGLRHDLRNGWSYDPEAVWRFQVRRQLSLDGLKLTAPKTAEAARNLLVEQTAMQLLVAHLNEHGHGPAMDGVTLIFGGRSVAGTVTGHQLYHAVSGASMRALGRKVGPHLLRHGYATHRLEHGDTVKTLQRDLGHSSSQVTHDLYLHAIERLGQRESVFGALVTGRPAAAPLPQRHRGAGAV